MDLHFIIWMIISAVSSAIPIPFMKYYLETRNIKWIIWIIILYFIGLYSYFITLQNTNIDVIYFITKMFSILLVCISGYFLFGYTLDMQTIFAFILGIISMYILSKKVNDIHHRIHKQVSQ